MTDANLAALKRMCAAATMPLGAEARELVATSGQATDANWKHYYRHAAAVAAEYLNAQERLAALVAALRLARALRVCVQCKLVGQHVAACNVCGGTEFSNPEELMIDDTPAPLPTEEQIASLLQENERLVKENGELRSMIADHLLTQRRRTLESSNLT